MQEKYPLILMLMLILPSMSILVLFDGDDDVCVDVRLIMVANLMLMSGKLSNVIFRKSWDLAPAR